ncbi:unnamed protein product [Phaeothamnion confervicola]
MEPCSAEIKYYDKAPQNSFVVYVIEVTFRGVSWLVEKRFSDFSVLQQRLGKEFPKMRVLQLPPKRFFGRFDPGFLAQRSGDLQHYLNCTLALVPVSDSRGLADFLEVAQHVNWEPQRGLHGAHDDDLAGQEAHEQERLGGLVEEMARALIDVSRVGVEPPEPGAVEAQREKLLRACDGFRVHASHFRAHFRPSVPAGDAEATATPEMLLETLSRAPRPPAEEQQRLLDRWGIAVTDHLRGASKVESPAGPNTDLVCHMQGGS